MDRSALTSTVRGLWDDDILPSLSALVAIPAISPAFDPAWATIEPRGEALLAAVAVPERPSQRRGLTIPVTIEPTRRAMTDVGNRYDTHVFDGAGHGFLRAQSGLEGANLRATEKAWPLTIAFLDRHTR